MSPTQQTQHRDVEERKIIPGDTELTLDSIKTSNYLAASWLLSLAERKPFKNSHETKYFSSSYPCVLSVLKTYLSVMFVTAALIKRNVRVS